MSNNAVQVHPFYREIQARLHICPGTLKHPSVSGYSSSELYADDVQAMLNRGEAQRYCWLQDHEHLVLDIDMHDGGGNGVASFDRLCSDLGVDLLSACGAVLLTPDGGGRHLYWNKPADLRIKRLDPATYPGIDTLGRSIRSNSLTIGAGSTHPVKPGLYTFTTATPRLVDAPVELLALLEDRTPFNPMGPGKGSDPRHAGKPGDDFMKSWDGVELLGEILCDLGYVFRGTYDESGAPFYEFQRPGKTTGSRVSGYLGKQSADGNYQLVSFSHADDHFPAGQSITILEALCRATNGGRGIDATDEGRERSRRTIQFLASRGFGMPTLDEMFGELPVAGSGDGRAAARGDGVAGVAAGVVGGGVVAPVKMRRPSQELWNFDVIGAGKDAKRVPKTADMLVQPFIDAGWPKSCGGMLFVPDGRVVDGRCGVRMMDGAVALFAWLHEQFVVHWLDGGGCVTKAEFYDLLVANCERVDSIAAAPHFPPVSGVWYSCGWPDVSQGRPEDFWAFVDNFAPATDLDRLLMAAAILTPFWGYPGGVRPMLVVTSTSQQNSGKSTFVDAVARLCGFGVQSKTAVTSNSDFERIGEKLASLSPLNPTSSRIIVVDNFRGACLSAADIESYVTSDILTCRRLYKGDVQIPNQFTWFVTGNAMAMSEDMASRSVEIALRQVEKSAQTAEWKERTDSWPVAPVIAGIGAILNSPPVPLSGGNRFPLWCREILGRVCPSAEVAEQVLGRIESGSKALSVESEDVQEFREILERFLKFMRDSRPEWSGFFIVSEFVEYLHMTKTVAPNGRPWNSRSLGRRIKTHLRHVADLIATSTENNRYGYRTVGSIPPAVRFDEAGNPRIV